MKYLAPVNTSAKATNPFNFVQSTIRESNDVSLFFNAARLSSFLSVESKTPVDFYD